MLGSVPHLLELLEQASCTRHTTTTRNYEASSRSQAFYRSSLVPHPSASTSVVVSATPMLQVVDPTGNERWEDATSHAMECIEEMKSINYSSGYLKECTRLLLKSEGTGCVLRALSPLMRSRFCCENSGGLPPQEQLLQSLKHIWMLLLPRLWQALLRDACCA